mmetsp:Transcript_25897/g.38262  ORF Transcript_25897/g.38262 Transcript_25897/m.38262 type:complete len:326 (-) Transcript_25897:1352-2329(-)|eukprot:CAMPEP_0194209112 /NCGR_PEP_ID=MMETSP0156-20130528/7346_1 /TAXON_ID=33649 /ORGANISM="Thalassionema nitzschioides, Strain L26-B" /LENGTH=325 /DNA_ID=CAMNT_0038936215 /DNA_START=72 /DNA_END=1049 /DNA_ORIENTATION=-
MASPSSKMQINNKDLLALKAYVTARDNTQYDSLPSDMILLDLTHSNLKQQHIEIRFFLSDTLESLRSKIYQKTGTPLGYQHLQVIGGGICLAEIPPEYDERTKLGFFSLEHGMRVHCIDLNPHSGSKGGQYENTDLVKKYRMSDEDYHKRKGTLRDWERKKKEADPTFSLRKHAKEHREMVEAQRQAKLGLELPKGFEYDENGKAVRIENDEVVKTLAKNVQTLDTSVDDLVGDIKVGMRCEVQPGARRGKVSFLGKVPELGGGGLWVGILFDEPVGKTDGSVKGGKRYFETPGNNYGGFVRPNKVEVGDFPERDIFDEDSDDEL